MPDSQLNPTWERILRKYTLTLISILLLTIPAAVNAERGIISVSGSTNQEARTALVIGNSAYKTSPLKNPTNDATDIASALRDSGFDVILKTDVNLRGMKNAIKAFGRKLKKGGVGMFYYAGHGVQVNGRNYLIPIEAEINTESEVEYEAVDAGRVLGQMEDAGNDLNIVILDACRNNPFARSFRSAEQGLAQMDAPAGSIIAYATAPGAVAADGKGRNGLYTKYLLKYIKQQGLKVEEIFKLVRVAVVTDTSKKQVPWESSSLIGNFYFISNGGDINITIKPEIEHIKPPQQLTGIPEFTAAQKLTGIPEFTAAQKMTTRKWQGTSLSEKEIIEAFSGKTVEGYHHRKKFSFKRYYSEDGTLNAVSLKKGVREDQWGVGGRGMCEFSDIWPEECNLLERDGEVIRKYNRKGRHAVSYFKFYEGNQL